MGFRDLGRPIVARAGQCCHRPLRWAHTFARRRHETGECVGRTLDRREPEGVNAIAAERTEHEYVVLGAGLAGLAAAATLGDRALVVEHEDRPGGLVRTENFNGYWFDRVIHLLYFCDGETESRVRSLLGATLTRCRPRALVEFHDGVVPFPFQTHLAGLPPREIVRCVRDFADAFLRASDGGAPPTDYESLLRCTFGQAMCERFFFPYNIKTWKRPLSTLAPTGFQWNLARPSFDSVMRGALGETDNNPYNGEGWYPRPAAGAPCRGMEVLSQALASRVHRLRLRQSVARIDLDRREISLTGDGRTTKTHWLRRCLSTIPLPTAIALCVQAPAELRRECAQLAHNRVRSVALSIAGPRPTDRGHWRYYPDESISFSRLVYMCEFDPLMAPPSGWGLLAEVSEPAEHPVHPAKSVIDRVCADVGRIGGIPKGCSIIDAHVMDADPAYVVFTSHSKGVVESACSFLLAGGVDAVGRYGKWEYSSMSQVMRDGFAWADDLIAAANLEAALE